jgi:membrane protein YqaA with SNARE-associated domain
MELERLRALGYPGTFLVAFLAAATVLVPLPGFVVIAGAGALLHPALVGLVAGLGAATGELVGYTAGRAGRAALTGRRGDRWHTAETWLRRFGFWSILALAAVPNPFFDALGLAAGALAYPTGRFWLASALGNSLKYVAIAYAGGSIPWPLVWGG